MNSLFVLTSYRNGFRFASISYVDHTAPYDTLPDQSQKGILVGIKDEQDRDITIGTTSAAPASRGGAMRTSTVNHHRR